MKKIVGYIRNFSKEVDKVILIISTLFIAGMVWLNYGAGLEEWLVHQAPYAYPEFTGRFLLFLFTFSFPYAIVYSRKKLKISWAFLACLLIAPFLFALKAGTNSIVQLATDYNWNLYWNEILYWPVRAVLMFTALAICWWIFNRDKDHYGLNTKNLQWKPYWLMLLFMVPLIAAASTQPDFLATYPKLKNILPLPSDAHPGWFYKLLYELSYGSDFFSIEFFFRGFLVIGFSRWVGKEAIIPMACFYCSIHFGKPLGECISSYFGGLLLGIVSYHTRSIYGGLMVHLGIAWLMEAGAIIGSNLF